MEKHIDRMLTDRASDRVEYTKASKCWQHVFGEVERLFKLSTRKIRFQAATDYWQIKLISKWLRL